MCMWYVVVARCPTNSTPWLVVVNPLALAWNSWDCREDALGRLVLPSMCMGVEEGCLPHPCTCWEGPTTFPLVRLVIIHLLNKKMIPVPQFLEWAVVWVVSSSGQ